MVHSNTQRMIDYWRSQGGFGGLPVRSAINPADFPTLMTQTFMLGRVASGVYPIRLAGGLIGDLHKRDLRGQNMLDLIGERDRFNLHTALETARRRPEPMVVEMEGRTDGASLMLEVLFAPIAGAPGSPERFLGLYQPLSLVAKLRDMPIRQLAVRSIQGVGPANEETHRLKLATLDGRRVA